MSSHEREQDKAAQIQVCLSRLSRVYAHSIPNANPHRHTRCRASRSSFCVRCRTLLRRRRLCSTGGTARA
eukprot:52450-Eustigmatos_ZCMA.PRE.1